MIDLVMVIKDSGKWIENKEEICSCGSSSCGETKLSVFCLKHKNKRAFLFESLPIFLTQIPNTSQKDFTPVEIVQV